MPPNNPPPVARPARRDSGVAAATSPGRTANDMQTPLLERWASMKDSEPAAPDEVPADLRALAIGTPVYVITFTEGDVRSEKAVAMSGVCRGTNDVTYVWVCGTANWAIHQATGQPVHVGTVHSQQVMLRSDAAGDR